MELKWKETESKWMTWDKAKSSEGDGWRLPTCAELAAAQGNEKIEGFFRDKLYWSSKSNGKKSAYAVNFKNGAEVNQYKACYSFVKLCKEI
jgi:hypothetical protein